MSSKPIPYAFWFQRAKWPYPGYLKLGWFFREHMAGLHLNKSLDYVYWGIWESPRSCGRRCLGHSLRVLVFCLSQDVWFLVCCDLRCQSGKSLCKQTCLHAQKSSHPEAGVIPPSSFTETLRLYFLSGAHVAAMCTVRGFQTILLPFCWVLQRAAQKFVWLHTLSSGECLRRKGAARTCFQVVYWLLNSYSQIKATANNLIRVLQQCTVSPSPSLHRISYLGHRAAWGCWFTR